MRYSNLHNHTTFSDGTHTIEENILAAIEKNMCSIGFSDHSYTPPTRTATACRAGTIPLIWQSSRP